MSRFIELCIILLKLNLTFAIWPPSYKINLSHEEDFIISANFDDNFNSDEDEMIKNNDIKSLNINDELSNAKYHRLHDHVKFYDKKEVQKKYTIKNMAKISKESNFFLKEPSPWIAGYADKMDDFIKNENINKNYDKTIQKREEYGSTDYDYNALREEYYNDIEKEKQSNETLKYSTVKENENLKESVDKILDFKTLPKNCTAEELKGIGLGAVECIVEDLTQVQTRDDKLKLFYRILKIVFIWICIYLSVASLCWCQRGWCCCCCCCKFCKPKEIIDGAKEFLINNPSGVLILEDGTKLEFKPTEYETYAYEKLNTALMNL